MEEIIKNRMKNAYDGIVLEEELRLKAKKNILAKARGGRKRKSVYGIMAAAAVVAIFVIGNMAMIQWNLGHGKEITPIESEKNQENESKKYLLAEFFADIEAESYLMEYSGEKFREVTDSEIVKNILYQIVVTNVEGKPSGECLLKITAQDTEGKRDYCAVEIYDNRTVIVDGVCYEAEITEEAMENIREYQKTYFVGYELLEAADRLRELNTMEDFENMVLYPNVYRRFLGDMGDNFCLAVLCYDADKVRCQPGSEFTKNIAYMYYKFDGNGQKTSEFYGRYDVNSIDYITMGAVLMDGDWYMVIDSPKDGRAHYYEIYDVTSSERSDYARSPESVDEEAYIRENAQFFVRHEKDYIMVGEIVDYGKVYEFSQVQNRMDLEELMNQPNSYYIALENNSYLVVQAYDGYEGSQPASSYTGQHDYIKAGHFVVDGNEVLTSHIMEFAGADNAMESMGITCFKGTWYLFGGLKDSEQYKMINLDSGEEEIMYCNEGICREILSSETIEYFAQGVSDYWLIGSDVVEKEDKDSRSYCGNHDWEDMCTSDMTVRDIYVTRNWIGGSAKKYIELELFFEDLVMTDFEDGIVMSDNSGENAYQVNNRFSEVNFQVSTELNSDEIIAVTLYGDHCYVTEDVWLGMDMEAVKKIMDIEESAFFEKDGYLYSFFERDGYLYEFSYVLSGGKRVLSWSCISDAAKIKESSVKSFGERLEEGRNIFAQ